MEGEDWVYPEKVDEECHSHNHIARHECLGRLAAGDYLIDGGDGG